MNKEWRIVELSPLISFWDKPMWKVSRRKLSDAEIEAMKLTRFHYDFSDELGICGDGSLIMSVITLPGASKEAAIAECAKLNDGKNPFEDLLIFDEEADNVEG